MRAMFKHRELLNFNITIIKISEYNLNEKKEFGIDSENPSVQENMLNIEPSPPPPKKKKKNQMVACTLDEYVNNIFLINQSA